MYSQRGKKYIYSVERANEFIQRGYRCIETGFNAKQQRFFGRLITMRCSHFTRNSSR